MNNYRQSKRAKFFAAATAFPIACLLAIFSFVIFNHNLKSFAPTASAHAVERTANATAVDDMPILYHQGNDIWKMSVDGQTTQNLTNSGHTERLWAQWSPDGRKIVYGRLLSSSVLSQICVINADGTNLIVVSEPETSSFQPQWSPNGQKIVYIETVANLQQIFTVNPDGTGRMRLTSVNADDSNPVYSPDGSRIAFARCGSAACDIYTMNADGSNQTNITPGNAGDDFGPLWSPDGTKIVYTAQDAELDYNTFVMDASGENPTQLTNTEAPIRSFPVDVSSTGRIGIQIVTSAAATYDIASIKLDGTDYRRWTINNFYDAFGRWSPDGAKLTYSSQQDVTSSEIYLMNADGTGVQRLTMNGTQLEGVLDWRGPAALPARTMFDYDGDAKADLSVFRPAGGNWFISNSSNNAFVAVQFGTASDLIAPADFDGDGRTDISVFRPTDGTWYRLNSTNNTFAAAQFGTNGDLPVPGDFDGDSRADISVYRPSGGFWYRINSSNNQFVAAQFGIAEDKPVIGDFDGDGRADLAVFRPSNGFWYRINSSNNSFAANQFGIAEDKPVPADYDGDGKTDLAVFRPGIAGAYWYRIDSGNGSFVVTQFGLSNDLPVPADYDGDGKADLALFTTGNGTWYLQRSTAGFIAVQFGAQDDKPTPNAYIR